MTRKLNLLFKQAGKGFHMYIIIILWLQIVHRLQYHEYVFMGQLYKELTWGGGGVSWYNIVIVGFHRLQNFYYVFLN